MADRISIDKINVLQFLKLTKRVCWVWTWLSIDRIDVFLFAIGYRRERRGAPDEPLSSSHWFYPR